LTGVAFSPDGRRALSGSFDGTARVWDLVGAAEKVRQTLAAKTPLFADGLGPGATLQDALDALAARHRLTFRIDAGAFEAGGGGGGAPPGGVPPRAGGARGGGPGGLLRAGAAARGGGGGGAAMSPDAGRRPGSG